MAALGAVPERMKAARLCEYDKPYEITSVNVPKITDTQLLVKVHAAGFCHSDLQVWHGQFGSKLPIIPSHEPAGTVVQIGTKCTKDKFKPGDRVGVLNFRGACAQCPGCRLSIRKSGGQKHLDPRFCERRETSGFQHDGAFAEYMVADPETTVLLPASISLEQAAPLMCAGATVWGSLEKATADLQPGDTVAIIGIGGLGHLGIQFAKTMGFRTVAVDSRPEGRQLAGDIAVEHLRPDLILDSTDEKATAKIFEFTDGEGLAAAVVCTDSLEANEWALSLLRIGGSLGVLGLPPAEKWRFDSGLLVNRELTIRGSYVASRESTERMMAVAEKHKVQSHLTVLPLDQVSEIIDVCRESSFRGRLVVQVSTEH